MGLRRVVLLLLLLASGTARAQEEVPADGATVTKSIPVPPALDAARIPQEAARLDRMIREIRLRSAAPASVQAIQAGLDADEEEVLRAAETTRTRLVAPGAASEVRDARSSWSRTVDRLDWHRRQVESYLARLSTDTAKLDALELRWVAGRDSLPSDAPRTLVTRANHVLKAIRDARRELEPLSRSAIDVVLRITALQESASVVRDDLDLAARARLLVRDSAPLWSVVGLDEGPDAWGGAATEAGVRQRGMDLWMYVQSATWRVVVQILFGLVLAVAFIRARTPTRTVPAAHTSSRAIVDRPLSSAAVLALAAGTALHALAPSAFLDLLVVAAVVPLWRTLQALMPGRTARVVFLLFAMFAVNRTVPLMAGAEASFRLALFAADALALGAAVWAHARLVGRAPVQGEPSARPFGWLLRVAAVAFAAALLANLGGFVALATLIVDGSMAALYLAVVLWVAFRLLDGCTRLALRLPAAQQVGMFRNHGEGIADRLRQAVGLVGVVTWVAYTLSVFSLLEPSWQKSESMLGAVVTIGSLELSLGNIVAFAVGGWLAVMAARVVRFALAEDVLPRMDLPRGMPATISKTSEYAVLTVGFFVALAAAGVRLDQFSFVAGALGLGIGFGLQTTANNFVSGLVMLFERPIQLGDVIEVGPLTGTVLHIGIRACRVRTLDGAEVIVPNGMLMANQVVNWTLSDRVRRFDLPVGVSYADRPERVVALLEQIALDTPGVVPEPSPTVLLEGFGSSSLDFVVRAWAPYDQYLAIRGDLAIRAEAGLREAGIAIPFPQRDLHVRSIDAVITESLGKGRVEAAEE